MAVDNNSGSDNKDKGSGADIRKWHVLCAILAVRIIVTQSDWFRVQRAPITLYERSYPTPWTIKRATREPFTLTLTIAAFPDPYTT